MTIGLAGPILRAEARLNAPSQNANNLLRIAAIGDGLVGPLVHDGRAKAGLERAFVDNSFVSWLSKFVPDLDIAETSTFSIPGGTTIDVARRLPDILDEDPGLDAVLICVGLADCMAAIRGGDPRPDTTFVALESIAVMLLTAGIKPIYIVPPPSQLFKNGLFADRFIAVAATIRRICAHDKRIGMIDLINLFSDKSAFGIEPDPRYISVVDGGRLTALGAFRLADHISRELRSSYPLLTSAGPLTLNDRSALNRNPGLVGSSGVFDSNAATGTCASEYIFESHQLNGACIQLSTQQYGAAQSILFAGRYSTEWGFVRLFQEVAANALDHIGPGDCIEACCDFALGGAIKNIVSVSLHVTAVWRTDFIGLHSSLYRGGAGVTEPYGGRLKTPPFRVFAPLKRLHLSLQAHLLPGIDLAVEGRLDIHNMVLRKVETQQTRILHDVAA